MFEKWRFNNCTLFSEKWGVETVLEGLGTPELRGEDRQVPYIDGKNWSKKQYSNRPLILAMWVKGNSMKELDENIDKLNRLFGKKGQHNLERIMRSGEVRVAKAEVYNVTNFPINRPGWSKFTIEFELSDPFFYSVNEHVDMQIINNNKYIWNHDNIGTAYSTKNIIKLKGPLSSPKLINKTNDIWVQYQGEILEGETVIIDTATFNCSKGEDNLISAIKHGGDEIWFILESGENNIKIESKAVGGSIEIKYKPAYF